VKHCASSTVSEAAADEHGGPNNNKRARRYVSVCAASMRSTSAHAWGPARPDAPLPRNRCAARYGRGELGRRVETSDRGNRRLTHSAFGLISLARARETNVRLSQRAAGRAEAATRLLGGPPHAREQEVLRALNVLAMGRRHGGRGRQAPPAIEPTGPLNRERRQLHCAKSRMSEVPTAARASGGFKRAVKDERRALQERPARAACRDRSHSCKHGPTGPASSRWA
jgi:hypothetical protein